MRCSARVMMILSAVLSLAATAGAAPQRGGGRGAMMHDPSHGADMQVVQELFERRAEITRTVTVRPDGVETLTTSRSPALVRLLQAHVAAMLARVKEQRPIHQRDPLFGELFRHAAAIEARAEPVPDGIRVVETSTDPYVAKLIQAHADVVSRFIANGRAEMMTDHPVPGR